MQSFRMSFGRVSVARMATVKPHGRVHAALENDILKPCDQSEANQITGFVFYGENAIFWDPIKVIRRVSHETDQLAGKSELRY